MYSSLLQSVFMKGIFLTILLSFTLAILTEVQAQSRPGDFEVGFVVGEPTGISLKYWQTDLTAFDGVLAWSFGRHESLHIHGSYLKHSPLEVEDELFSLYYGIGGRAIFAEDAVIGVPYLWAFNISSPLQGYRSFLKSPRHSTWYPLQSLEWTEGLASATSFKGAYGL